MKVYSLTGKSGTGKSYQAMSLCKEKGINSIIDDGLFIHGHRVEAGISAKRQKTMVGAIKTALFNNPEHQEQVVAAIARTKPDSLLILGTSDQMADRIAKRLGVGPIDERIHIEDITTEEERQIARKQRVGQGKHVIPVPTFQVKRAFAGYFISPLRIIKDNFRGASQTERTVVRPTFSYMGDFIISDKAVADIVHCVAVESDGIMGVPRVYVNTEPEALQMYVTVDLETGCSLWETTTTFQQRLAQMVERMTAFNIVNVSINVRKLLKPLEMRLEDATKGQ
jgi:uncharacterized alkaline shock family protein YloU